MIKLPDITVAVTVVVSLVDSIEVVVVIVVVLGFGAMELETVRQ